MLTLDLLSEVDRLQDQMNRLFSGAAERRPGRGPALNVWAGDDQLTVTAELPGADIDKLDISVQGHHLTLRGSFPEEQLREGESWVRQEFGGGDFVRTLELPYRIEQDKVEARYRNGVLYLTLPRAEAEKPRKVAVKTA